MGVVTAKALNSTLGTSNFKGFDELLYDVLSRVHTESRVLKYSETEVYMSIPKEKSEFRGKNGYKITSLHQPLISFTFPHSGEVGLSYNIGFDTSSDTQDLNLEVYKNGVLYDTVSTSSTMNSEGSSIMRIVGKTGDVIDVKTSVTIEETGEASTSSKANICLYNIYATVLDVRPITFS